MRIREKSETMRFLENAAGRPLTLGGLLESIRLSEDMSQAEFSKKLRISASHLCDIEKGRKVVSPERAARFAKILGRSQQQFVRFALQQLVNEAGLKMKVDVAAAYCAVRKIGGRPSRTAQSGGESEEGRRSAPLGRVRGEG